MRRALIAGLAAGLLLALTAPAYGVIPAAGVISKKNMEWVFNNPQAVGGDIEFYEELQSDGSVSRYALTTSMGNGFNIYDITDPELPLIAGSFVDPGVNWQGDLQVNPRRKIAVLATQGSIGFTVGHGGSDGLAFVDISDVSSPTLLGVVNGLAGAAHNSTIIDDQTIYTTGAARMVDYSDPAAPKDLGGISDAEAGVNMCGGHDITVDPNRPHIVYNACGGGRRTEIWNVTDPRSPKFISVIPNSVPSIAHQADPNLDSSLLFVTHEQGGGTGADAPPSGGIHIWDISGKYIEGASLEEPKKVGFWVAPFYGLTGTPSQGSQWGNVTAHNMTFQAERELLSIGWYTAGSWVADMNGPTVEGGLYEEYKGTALGGPTNWGNTTGNFLPEGAETWSTKWTRFDDPLYDRFLFTNDISRGMDVFTYEGPMPQKEARLSVSDGATGGVVSGVLDRYAVWTHQGFVNKALAGETLTVESGGVSVEATSGDDGSFSADLGLEAGTHTVTVTWAGNDVYEAASVTQTVTV